MSQISVRLFRLFANITSDQVIYEILSVRDRIGMVPGRRQGLPERSSNEWLNGLVDVLSTIEEESGNARGVIFLVYR